MKNRRNHSSHEEEYFFRISLKTISDVNEFCNVRETREILSESIDVVKSYKELVEEIIDEYGLDIGMD